MFSSNKISQPNLKRPTYRTDLVLLMFLHTRQTIPVMLSGNYPQHNTLSMDINMHYTPSTTLPTAFQNTPTHTTQNIVGKMAQDVGMVWMCCGVVPILFGWFMRTPSLHALIFIGKTFVTLYVGMWVCGGGPTVKWWLVLPHLECPQWPLPLVVPPPHAHHPPDMHASLLSSHPGEGQ